MDREPTFEVVYNSPSNRRYWTPKDFDPREEIKILSLKSGTYKILELCENPIDEFSWLILEDRDGTTFFERVPHSVVQEMRKDKFANFGLNIEVRRVAENRSELNKELVKIFED